MRSQPSPTRSRSREQRAGTVAQNLGQRIGKTSWMGEPENVSVGHGVSLLQWRSGGVEHPHDTPPYPFTPSPTFVHSSRWMGSPNSPLDHGMSPFGTEGTFHLRLPISAHWARPDVSRTCPYRRV